MLKKYLLITLLIASLSVITGCEIMDYLPDEEKPPPGYGTLSGNVVDDLSGVGLWMGTVEIAGQVTEIEGGKFQVENIPVGPQNLLISKEFYQDQKIEVIIENQTNMIDVKMTPIFSDSDLDLFARMVHAESRGEPYRGQVAVAASILNRVRHHNYPNTLRGVMYSRSEHGYAEYSPIDDGSINIPASQTAINAARDALSGWDPSLGATGFFAPAKVPDRSNWVWQQIPIIDIGNHRFFRARTD